MLLAAPPPIEKGRMGANADTYVGTCHAAAAKASSTCVAARVFIFVRQRSLNEERRQAATRPTPIMCQPRSKFLAARMQGRVESGLIPDPVDMTRAAASRFAAKQLYQLTDRRALP